MRLLPLVMACLLASPIWGQTRPAELSAGQAVQVREGDEWSPATIVKKEGRKYLIRYSGGEQTEEWVTAERIRSAGAAAASEPAGAEPAAPAKAPAKVWRIKDNVEVKWGGSWWPAQIRNTGNGWYLVQYTTHTKEYEWVEPWRIRAAGSTTDELPHVSPGHSSFRPEPPPKEKPGAAPEKESRGAAGRQTAAAAAGVKITDANIADAREVTLGGAAGMYSPNPAPPAAALTAKPISLKGGSNGFFENFTGLAVSPGKALAVISYEDGPPGKASQGFP